MLSNIGDNQITTLDKQCSSYTNIVIMLSCMTKKKKKVVQLFNPIWLFEHQCLITLKKYWLFLTKRLQTPGINK